MLQSIHSEIVLTPLSNQAAATNFASAEGGMDDSSRDGSLNLWRCSKWSPGAKSGSLTLFLLGLSEHLLSLSSKPGAEQTGEKSDKHSSRTGVEAENGNLRDLVMVPPLGQPTASFVSFEFLDLVFSIDRCGRTVAPQLAVHAASSDFCIWSELPTALIPPMTSLSNSTEI
jgi:hypothetical protein